MKICLIASLFPPYERGGAEVVANTLVLALKEAGHEICVITTCPFFGVKSLKVQKDFADGVRVFRFFPLNIFWFGHIAKKSWVLRFFWHVIDTLNLHTFIVVRALLKREKPDLVLTHNLKGFGYTTPRAVKSLKYPLIHTVHDVQLFTPSGLILFGEENAFEHNNICTKLYRCCTRWLFSVCDTVIFPSSFLKNFYEQQRFFQRAKKVVLSNPVKSILRRYPWSVIPAAAGNQKNRRVNLIYVGQIETHKGIFFLVDTLQKRQENNFSLHIIGKGSLEEKLLAQIQGDRRFQYHGFLSREALQNLVLKMDLLVFPSLCYENLPTVIIESLRCGVPVLGSNIGGVSELIQDGYNGVLFDPGDASDLTKKLLWCIENVSTLKSWKQACIHSISSFGVEYYKEQLFQLVEDVDNENTSQGGLRRKEA